MGELPRLLAALRPVLLKLTAEPDWFALIASDGPAVIEALAVTCRSERAWVEGLDLDDAVRLAVAVFEVNGDFFVGRVAPEVRREIKPPTGISQLSDERT